MQHLIRRYVVQHKADSFGSVDSGWHRNQFTLWQANKLRIPASDRQRGNYLTWFDSNGSFAESIDHTDEVPTRRERQSRRLGMNTLAHHYVGQRNTRSQHS